MQEVISVAERNGVKFDQNNFSNSEEKMKLYIKAYLGRRIWGNEGFYPVLHQKDEILQKALELFDEAEDLARN